MNTIHGPKNATVKPPSRVVDYPPVMRHLNSRPFLNCFQSAVVEIFAGASDTCSIPATSMLVWDQVPYGMSFADAYAVHLASIAGHGSTLVWTCKTVLSGDAFLSLLASSAPCIVSVDIKRIRYRKDLRSDATLSCPLHSLSVTKNDAGVAALIDHSAGQRHDFPLDIHSICNSFDYPLELFILTRDHLEPRSSVHASILALIERCDAAVQVAALKLRLQGPADALQPFFNDLTFLMLSRKHFCEFWTARAGVDLSAVAEQVDRQIALFRQQHFASVRARIGRCISADWNPIRAEICKIEAEITTRLVSCLRALDLLLGEH